MSSNLPIGNGQNPNKGDRVRAKHIVNLDEKIKRLSRRVNIDTQVASKFVNLPFDPAIRIKEGTSSPYEYQISVSRGIVVERQLSAGTGVDALIYHEPDNALTDDLPTWFDIDDGESLFVKVPESSDGKVTAGATLVLVVAASTTESTNYIPSTQAGEYYYKICEFTIVDDFPVIERFVAGSHIYHETGLTHDMQFLTCEDPIYFTQTQLARLTFTSGRLVSVDETVASRPLSPSTNSIDLTSCS